MPPHLPTMLPKKRSRTVTKEGLSGSTHLSVSSSTKHFMNTSHSHKPNINSPIFSQSNRSLFKLIVLAPGPPIMSVVGKPIFSNSESILFYLQMLHKNFIEISVESYYNERNFYTQICCSAQLAACILIFRKHTDCHSIGYSFVKMLSQNCAK